MAPTSPAKLNRQKALTAMLVHAARHSRYYRDQTWATRLRGGQTITFAEIPITLKAVVKAEAQQFHSAFVPSTEGRVFLKHTSGATGEPTAVPKTERHFRINSSENKRLSAGWGHDQHRRSVYVISHDEDAENGKIVEQSLPESRKQWTIYSADSSAVFDLLRRTEASFVMTFPSIARAVLEQSLESQQPLPLTLIQTVSEILPDELRLLAASQTGCRLFDCYGCVEAGLIAAQCSICGNYHLAERHLIAELVDETGAPARPGELGRVLVTPLFNRAMPLLRYETGDYAVASDDRDCPRSPVALARIVGRERNLFRLPDGRRIAPGIPVGAVDRLGLRRYKLLQTAPTNIDFLYIPRDSALEIPQAAFQALVHAFLSLDFSVRPVRVDDMPRTASGKYLTHESLV